LTKRGGIKGGELNESNNKLLILQGSRREFSKRVLDILNSNVDVIKKAGVDVTAKSEELKKLVDEAREFTW
jgi:hypothetical protein